MLGKEERQLEGGYRSFHIIFADEKVDGGKKKSGEHCSVADVERGEREAGTRFS